MLRNLLLALASAAFALVAAEVALRVFTVFPIHGDQNNRIYDSELLFRTSPKVEGVDERGGRNEGIKPPYDIIAIGDSHTFGFNVAAKDNWPSIVGREFKKNVYNLSAGGYNLIQYLSLFNMALKENPKTIIVGFFPNNDLIGLCSVLASDYWEQHKDIYKLGSHCDDASRANESVDESLWEIASSRSAIASGIRYVFNKYEIFGPVVAANKKGPWKGNLNVLIELKGQKFRIRIFETERRKDITQRFGDRSDAKKIFSYMKAVARERDIRLIVMFIPSLELVLKTGIEVMNEPMPSSVRSSVRREIVLRNIFMQEFQQQGVEFIDALPYTSAAFVKDLREHKDFYPLNSIHPKEAGYRAYAQAVIDYLRKHPATAAAE